MTAETPSTAPFSLAGKHVELQALTEAHIPGLLAAAADGELWNMKVTIIPGPDTVAQYVATALAGQRAGTVMPFVTVRRDTGQVAGSTRFWKIDRTHRKLEIGHTWLGLAAQGQGINTEAKYLMLRHAFESMDCVRVQFTTDVLNAKSRTAILGIGATQEGIVRHERIMPDGRKRDSVRFSIIDSEWPAVKLLLQGRLGL